MIVSVPAGIRIDDGQRDPLPFFIHLQDDELAGAPLPGNVRGLKDHPDHIFRQILFFNNSVH